MKRSDINRLVRDATACFTAHGWTLPPHPRWDVTDLGLGDWRKHGLVLVNLAEEPEYCEKLMYAKRGMVTPIHCHRIKKEDIICRWGELSVTVWPSGDPPAEETNGRPFEIQITGEQRTLRAGETVRLRAGERVTMEPGIWHSFVPATGECIIGEVSTANDDLHDNYFADPDIGRFPGIDEDEPPIVKLLGET
ncbi:MAG TPA: D-lyxose/D-mannose family sugar isomerase [Fimbriimonadaceae bacterium]|nr:D-lyxose/D-mannose family sugar isomerase [Fimbriimonadaceae bacterium]